MAYFFPPNSEIEVVSLRLSIMSCIDPRDIPQSLLPLESSQVKQQNALGLLKAYSFITGQANDRIISLHRLVHLDKKLVTKQRGT